MPPRLVCRNPECCGQLNETETEVEICAGCGLVYRISGDGAKIDPEATRRAYREATDAYAPFYTPTELEPDEAVPVIPMAELERAMTRLQLAERGAQPLARLRLS
jgi:hypothetical protein